MPVNALGNAKQGKHMLSIAEAFLASTKSGVQTEQNRTKPPPFLFSAVLFR